MAGLDNFSFFTETFEQSKQRMDGQPEISPHSFRSGSPATRRILLVLWLCFLLRAVFYCALFPMWEGYDEYSHFAFVQHVATNASLPLAVQTRASREIEESLKLVPLPWLLRNLPAQHLPHCLLYTSDAADE